MKINFAQLSKDKPWGYPQIMSSGAAGYDLTATEVEVDHHNDILTIKYNIAVEIPEKFMGMLVPRSSVYKRNLIQCNSVGIIDSDYRGEIMQKFYFQRNFWGKIISDLYEAGDRTGQLLILPVPEVQWRLCNSLEDTSRGKGGFGSTDTQGSN